MSPKLLSMNEVRLGGGPNLTYMLGRGSSPVDWCEGNYLHNSFIAETGNTVTNLVFLLYTPLLVFLSGQFARNIHRGIYIIWALYAFVGLSSAYFHATLSLLGQLLDELSILWLIASAFSMLIPSENFPNFIKRNRGHLPDGLGWLRYDARLRFSLLVGGLTCAFSAAAFVYPKVNAYALMMLCIPTFWLLYRELSLCTDQRINRLAYRGTITACIAMSVWLLDRMFCSVWHTLGAPYLHGLWHILIAFSSSVVIWLFAYFHIEREHRGLQPVLRFWPNDNWELAVPYVELKNAHN